MPASPKMPLSLPHILNIKPPNSPLLILNLSSACLPSSASLNLGAHCGIFLLSVLLAVFHASVPASQGKALFPECRSDHIDFLLRASLCITKATGMNPGSLQPLGSKTHHRPPYFYSPPCFYLVTFNYLTPNCLLILWPQCSPVYLESVSLIYLTQSCFLLRVSGHPGWIWFHIWLTSAGVCDFPLSLLHLRDTSMLMAHSLGYLITYLSKN